MFFRADLSRRRFLKTTGMAVGAGVLGGMDALAQVGSQKAIVGIARGDTTARAVREAVRLAGGMDFIGSAQTVLVKPNVNTGDPYPASTNPEVVLEVVKMAWERDPKRVIVGDRSTRRMSTINEMRRSGIEQAARDGKAEVMYFDDLPWELVKPAKAANWQNGYRTPSAILQADHVISLPVVKTHSGGWFTMSLKNFVGIIHPDDRGIMHAAGGGGRGASDGSYATFARMIAELGLIVTPALVVMDGTKAFVNGGPSSGDLVEPKLIIASRDRIANDITGLGVLKHYGTESRIQDISAWKQPMIARGIEIGLGVSDLSQIDLRASGVPELDKIRAQMA
jgi:uncharacterized protein (DUF362 family)